MELVLTSTTHGLTSGQELVSSSEESRKSESALWERAMESLSINLRGFAEKIVCYDSTFRKTVRKSKHFEDKDRRALAAEFVANMTQLYHRAASECRQQHCEEFAPTVTSGVTVAEAKCAAQCLRRVATRMRIGDEWQGGYASLEYRACICYRRGGATGHWRFCQDRQKACWRHV